MKSRVFCVGILVLIALFLVLPLMPIGTAEAAGGLPANPVLMGDSESKGTIHQTKDYLVGYFNNIPEYGHIYYAFDPNGTITVTDDFGNSLELKVPSADIGATKNVKPALKLYQNKGKNQVYYAYTSSVSNYRVIYDFSSKPNEVEIILKGSATSSGHMNIPLDIKASSRTETDTTSVSAVAVDKDGKERARLSYNWSDAPTTCTATTSNIKFSVDTSFDIDPSIVGTSTAVFASGFGPTRNSFYAQNLNWVVYHDGTNLVYRTSSDGTAWSAATTLRAGANQFYGIAFDGTYACYAANLGTSVGYRRFTPNSDGTVTYSAAEQTAVTASMGVTISVDFDSTGHPWIGYSVSIGGGGFNWYGYVTKSSTSDGTWSTASGFPYQLIGPSGGAAVTLAPLNSSNMLVVYSASTYASIYSQVWDGTMESQRLVTSGETGNFPGFSVVSSGNSAYLTWVGTSPKCSTYTYPADLWASEVPVSSTSSTYSALSIDSSGNLFEFFYTTGGDIKYRERVGTTWEASDTTITALGAATVWSFTSSKYAWGGIVGIVYSTGAGAPYNVNFASLTSSMVPAVSTLAASGVGSTNATMNGNLTNTGGSTVTKRGFDWGTDISYGFEAVTTNSTYSVGPFSYGTLVFSPGVTYHYRAKAYSVTGWGYGVDVTFTTVSINGTIETRAANPIARNSATLNSYIIADGGLDCQVRFEWGSVSGGPYPSNSGWYGVYRVGASPQYVISSLTENSLYYFRVRLQNANGVGNGTEMSFLASDTVNSPSILIAVTRSSTEISTKWTPGAGSSSSFLRYKVGSAPTLPSEGTLAYNGAANSHIITGLSPGTTYGVSVWGYDSGNYSVTYLWDIATTFAGTAVASTGLNVTESAGMYQTPGYTKLHNLPFYDLFNSVADQIHWSRAAFWMFIGIFVPIILGTIGVYTTKEPLIGLGLAAFGLLGGYMSGAFPGWFIGVFLLLGGGILFLMGKKG